MALLTIHSIPSEVLRKVAVAVPSVDRRVAKLMEDMAETMYKGNGIGLAANQVGMLDRVITIDLSEDRDGKNLLMMANPEIIWSDPDESFVYNEGCLSVSGHYANVERPRRIRMKYLDQHGKERMLEAEDLMSQAIQHEVDHLDGILFIDHLSKLKRNIILKKVEKERKGAL